MITLSGVEMKLVAVVDGKEIDATPALNVGRLFSSNEVVIHADHFLAVVRGTTSGNDLSESKRAGHA